MIEQQFVEFVVGKLVDHPDQVSVKRTEDDRGVLLELSGAPDDLGRVIGRRGATAQSLRNILRALGAKNDARYNLKIVDTDNREEAGEAASTTENDEAVDTVENKATEDVEKTLSRADKLRQNLADLDDLDI
ncbi:KH domain-containing protein [Candidatus Saccharibacteria bacterium]|nr:KH domain-containing protein [Candidatus Saccharibacteria bacterium]